jgi:hypothetical protein
MSATSAADVISTARDNMGRPRKPPLEAELVRATKAVPFEVLLDKDAINYLENRRLEYIQRIERIAEEAENAWRDATDPAARKAFMDTDLKASAYLLRLTSAYKTKVDVTASQLGLLKPPDLSKMTDADLKALEQTVDIEGTEVKEQ